MTCPAWNDLCQQPTLTVSTEKYAQLVYDSTNELHQPVQSILSALDRRAMGLAKLAHFESALRDADVMQHLSPSSPLGYLRKAIIYGEQGKQRHVIDICNQALAIVDTTNPGYLTLQQAKADAEDQLKTRIDFIKELPFDILSTTLVPMLMGDSPLDIVISCPYLYVSNLWRDSIIQCSGGLCFKSEFQAEFGDEYDEDKARQLVTFARHTKSLDIYAHCEGTWVVDVLRENDFSSLQKLYLRDFYTFYIEDFISSFQSIGNTLTHLEFDQEHMILAPSDLLVACPNLVSFSLWQTFPASFSSLPMKMTWPKMTTLSIRYGEGAVSDDEIISISQRFPALQRLTLNPCFGIRSAFMASQYYPAMNGIEIDISNWSVHATLFNRGTGYQELAVTRLCISKENWADGGGSFMDTSSILKQHQKALEDIKWKIFSTTRQNDEVHNVDDFANIQYPRLKKLSLLHGGWWMLPNAPVIEELALSSRTINTHPEVLDTIPPKLERLILDFDDWHNLQDSNSVVYYLYRVSQQCQLHELSIRFDNSENAGNVLDAIDCLNHLQSLIIRFNRDWSEYQMEAFVERIANGCPLLSCLQLKCHNAPSTHLICTLKRFRFLKQLGLSVSSTDGHVSFWRALGSLSKLSSIQMYPKYAVNKPEVQQLKKQIPHVEVTSEYH